MQVGLLDLDVERQPRRLGAAGRQFVEQGRIARERRAPVDPQRLAHPGQQEEQGDVRVLEDVGVRVLAAVAGVVGEREAPLVEDPREARRPAARRAVAMPVGAGGRQERDRRARDEVAAVAIEVVELLVEHRRPRLADVVAQLVGGADGMVEHA